MLIIFCLIIEDKFVFYKFNIMDTTNILDVTVIEPRLKHPTIFQKFDSLLPGTFFVIHNDHDPKPLYYQLLAERGQTFIWEYLASGPEVWQVKITKREVTNVETIGEMVTKDYRKAQVFKKYGIDFCCGGKKTLSEVAAKKGLDESIIKAELDVLDRSGEVDSGLTFDKWELDFLSDYIVNTHHQYVKENIPFISELSQKVARVHGDRHPEAIQVALTFDKIAQELSLHLMKEEKILFPFIKDLVQAKKGGLPLPQGPFDDVSSPIHLMEVEHEHAGEDLEEIREITSNYELPADACTSYRILYKKLEEFENDLHKHVHLENNILFPKAVQLEKDLK